MTAALPRSATALAECRAIVGGMADPFAAVWNGLPESERSFWLRVARQSHHLAAKKWADLSGDVRCRVKNGLYRAAERASILLKAAA